MNETPQHRLPLDPRWGWLGLLFYGAQAGALVATGDWPGVLWSCHLGSVLAGIGILFDRPRIVAVAFCWLFLGLPMWFIGLSSSVAFYPTSVLTHFGGLALAFVSLRRTGTPRGVWTRATLALGVLWILTRIVTPATSNVNLTHSYWFGFEGRFVSFPVFLVAIYAAVAGLFRLTEGLLRRFLGPSYRPGTPGIPLPPRSPGQVG